MSLAKHLRPGGTLEERLAGLEAQAILMHRRWRESFRAVMIALFLVLSGFFLGSCQAKHEASERRLGQIAACQRENFLRAEKNASALQQYEVNRDFITIIELGLSEPEAEQPQLTEDQKRKGREVVTALFNQLREQNAEKSWTPLIASCAFAIDHPRTFVPEGPIPFSLAEPPPTQLLVPRSR